MPTPNIYIYYTHTHIVGSLLVKTHETSNKYANEHSDFITTKTHSVFTETESKCTAGTQISNN